MAASSPPRSPGVISGSDLALLRVKGATLVAAEPAPQPARVGQFVLALGRPTPERHSGQPGCGQCHRRAGAHRAGWLARKLHPHRCHPLPRLFRRATDRRRRAGAGRQYLRAGAWPGFDHPDRAGLAGCRCAGRARLGAAWLFRSAQPAGGFAPAQKQTLGRDQNSGLLLVGIEDDGPAAQAGLLVGDILVGVSPGSLSATRMSF